MIWGVVLVSLIAGGTIGFIICGLLTAEAINDRDEQIQRLQKDISFERLYSKALKKPPKDFLGWSNDPENPDYQKFHAWGTKLMNKAINGELPNQKKRGDE